MTTESLIPYEDYVQAALRGVVARILKGVDPAGLPGNHHFYIAFRTRYPGVVVPKSLLEKYPDEMTIVLQNRFWDLQVHEDYFEVGLSFNQTPTKIVVPFNALIGFVDPAVNFGLQFQPPEIEAAATIEVAPEPEPADTVSGEAATPAGDEPATNVITLDRFRKKS